MVWIFYYAEQVAEVLQRDMFEDGKHLRDPQCPWRCQVGGDLQLQGHAGWPRGWPCAREPCRSCRPQTTPPGSMCWAGASPFFRFFEAWAGRPDAADAPRGWRGLGVAVLHDWGSGCGGSLSSLRRACSDSHHASHTAFTEQKVVEGERSAV